MCMCIYVYIPMCVYIYNSPARKYINYEKTSAYFFDYSFPNKKCRGT